MQGRKKLLFEFLDFLFECGAFFFGLPCDNHGHHHAVAEVADERPHAFYRSAGEQVLGERLRGGSTEDEGCIVAISAVFSQYALEHCLRFGNILKLGLQDFLRAHFLEGRAGTLVFLVELSEELVRTALVLVKVEIEFVFFSHSITPLSMDGRPPCNINVSHSFGLDTPLPGDGGGEPDSSRSAQGPQQEAVPTGVHSSA